ncbi:SRPBCC family protein [Streptomyces malaysiensis]|uniref:Activator of Hsp90 ATPase 1 family protein n=2 Tax=Streptomyces malaysiensis TaxID=92644 RepID=A0A7X6B1L6_STRMQ|nr:MULTISPECIES: SRPBCC domain-containing protein [Streptomyces]MCQ8828859.1 SRPBCC domain-containing protein [Streptomyces samsunensis]NIY70659.1 Activator of Hsp90 ATPase 1 family protein [Streptomyces malaysiensis]
MSTTEITITRDLDAPRETVWRVWTEPEYFARWFGAAPESVALDVRPGGAWKATVATPGGEMPMRGVYREVVGQERLVWTLDLPQGAMEMTATLAELGDGRTRVVLRQPAPPREQCAQAEEGANRLLDSFAKVLASV